MKYEGTLPKYVYTTQSNHTYEQEESGDDSNLCVNVSLDEFDSNLAKCKKSIRSWTRRNFLPSFEKTA